MDPYLYSPGMVDVNESPKISANQETRGNQAICGLTWIFEPEMVPGRTHNDA